MRRRFWVSLIICLFAAFSILTFVAISEEECKEGVCAGATVTGGSELKAKTRVSAPRVFRGQWGMAVVAGDLSDQDRQWYRRGCQEKLEVEYYTDTARASAYNVAENKYGTRYSVSAFDSKPDN